MREILESHSASALKAEIRKSNIKGYSKMTKGELVNLMLKHKDRFSHIKHSGKTARQTKPRKKKVYKSKEFVGEEDNVPDTPKKKIPKISITMTKEESKKMRKDSKVAKKKRYKKKND